MKRGHRRRMSFRWPDQGSRGIEGKRKIRNEKWEVSQVPMGCKKLPQGHRSAIWRFSKTFEDRKIPCFPWSVFRRFIPLSFIIIQYNKRGSGGNQIDKRPSDKARYCFFCSFLLQAGKRYAHKRSWLLYPSFPFLHLNRTEHDTVRQCY